MKEKEMEYKVSTIDWLSMDAPEKYKESFRKGLKIVAVGEILDLSSMAIGERIEIIGQKENMYYKNAYRRVK